MISKEIESAAFWGELPQDVAEYDDPAFWDDAPTPVFWRLLVMPDVPQEFSKGGIALPAQTQEAEQYLSYVGKVVKVGSLAFKDKRLNEELRIPKVGEYVLFGRYAGQVVRYKGIRLLLINDDEILAVTANREALHVHL